MKGYCDTCGHPHKSGYNEAGGKCTMPLDKNSLPIMRNEEFVRLCGCSKYECSEEPRFHVQYRAHPTAPWGPPSVGGIEDGFDSQGEARELIRVLIEHDPDYYVRPYSGFRILKTEATEVFLETSRKMVRT